MTFTSNDLKLQSELADKIEDLLDDAVKHGLTHRMAGIMLLEISRRIAEQGGPLVHFDHTLWMQEKGKTDLRAFEQEYRDQLDWDELIKGRVVPKRGQDAELIGLYLRIDHLFDFRTRDQRPLSRYCGYSANSSGTSSS